MIEDSQNKSLWLENWSDFKDFKARVLLGEDFDGWNISLDFDADFAEISKILHRIGFKGSLGGYDIDIKFGGSNASPSAGGNGIVSEAAVVELKAPSASLLNNGVSQIIGFDTVRHAVGYIANEGKKAPLWTGIWEWGNESKMKAVACGHFAGSKVDHAGLLLYNEETFAFSAWTDITDDTYGYVGLGNAGSAVEVKAIGNFDGNSFDDAVVVKENGSIGVMLDVKNYKAVTSGSSVELAGTGTFTTKGLDSLVVKENGAFWIWSTSDLNAGWTKTKVMNANNQQVADVTGNWEVVGIGDFKGDGIDDIIVSAENGFSFLLNDGKLSDVQWASGLSADFEVAGVGDYDGNGKEDLLLREMKSGWGGLGFLKSGLADETLGGWFDLNARIETTDAPGHSGIFVIASKVS